MFMNCESFIKSLIGKRKKLYLLFLSSEIIGWICDYVSIILFTIMVDKATNYIKEPNEDNLNILIVFFSLQIFIAFSTKVFMRIVDYVEAKLTPSINLEIATKMFRHITNHSISYFENSFSGAIAQKIKQVIDLSKFFTIDTIKILAPAILFLVITIIVLIVRTPLLGLFILMCSIFYIWFFYKKAKYNKKLASEWAEANSDFNGYLIDSIENMILIKSHTMQESEINHIRSKSETENNRLSHLKINMLKLNILATLLSSVLVVVILIITTYLYVTKNISIGDLIFNYTVAIRINQNLYSIGDFANEMLEKIGGLKNAIEQIYSQQENDNELGNISIKDNRIVFDKVTFGYTSKNIFENFDLKIEPNQKLAIVGASGSGKSTLVKLLMKQYKIKSGNITIGGHEINNYNSDSINNCICYINQNIHLFNRSIKENIGYVKPNATDKEIENAAKSAGCLEFINNKISGFDTIIGERGVKLSGGEKQRISLARAFLLDKPIIILDEPTAALDTISEKYIQDGLEELSKNRTLIVIAHRLSTVKDMDKIIVLEEGKIIESGTHSELLENNNIYNQLWSQQKT